jgi:phage baseplate assembly protein gpV
VTDDGIVLTGPSESVTVNGSGITVSAPTANVDGDNVAVDAQGEAVLKGSMTQLGAGNGCLPIARETDSVAVSGDTGTIVTGDPTATAC